MIPAPDKLFSYQLTGALWLKDPGQPVKLLADDMGLGKTPQTVAGLWMVSGGRPPRALISGPAIARYTWQRECVRWAAGINAEAQVLIKLTDVPRPTGVVICSFDYIREDFQNRRNLWKYRWDAVVLDEAHGLAATQDDASKRSVAILGQEGVARRADRVWFLTGTPMKNHAANLWLFASFSGLTELDYDDWVDEYCTTYRHNDQKRVTGTRQIKIPQLRSLLVNSGMFLRRKREEVKLQLPPVIYSERVVEAQYPTELELIDGFPSFFAQESPGERIGQAIGESKARDLQIKIELEREVLKEALGDPNDMSDVKMMKLKALAKSISTLIRYVELQKISATVEHVISKLEADPKLKVVIFAGGKTAIESLRVRLQKFSAKTIYGGTPPEKRLRHIDNFNEQETSHRVLILQIIAAGTNINLAKRCQWGIILQPPFVPGDLDQACKRIDRIGQTGESVLMEFIMLANDPVDQGVMSIIKRKRASIAAVVDGVGVDAPIKVSLEDML